MNVVPPMINTCTTARYHEQPRVPWIGETGPDAVFYDRVHSPVILIELDHQGPGSASFALGSPETPSRTHIHTMVHTPNGNDYGKDLLRQDDEQHPHA